MPKTPLSLTLSPLRREREFVSQCRPSSDVMSNRDEAEMNAAAQGCIKLSILSPRGTSGETTEERGNQ